MSTFHLDYENGSDAADGSDWANAWKTITSGATAARIAPGDTIKIAKSPDTSASLGNGTWTNLSKTVTLATAQTATIDNCETAWTAAGGGDITVARTAVATDAKQGSYCMKLTFDAAVQTSIMEAYYATGTLNLSAYQKLSFWIKNSGAVTAGTARIALCSDTAGATPVDYFDIPAIPSINQWIPLTLIKSGGGNLGSSIQSIALYTDSAVTGLASKYFYVDNFIACTTAGLNLQSLISKNSLSQGGTEGFYGIQSIDGVTVLLDNHTNTLGSAGMGYSGTTETVATYKRETIKTAINASSTGQVQAIQDSGTNGSLISFTGGWNTSTDTQDGETYFDGLNGFGYGLYQTTKNFIYIDKINFVRYQRGLTFSQSNNYSIGTVKTSNNTQYAVYINGSSNTIDTVISNNNGEENFDFTNAYNNTINNLYSNNNALYNIYITTSYNNTIKNIYSNNCTKYGVYLSHSNNNKINSLSTSGNTLGGVYNTGNNYIKESLIAESTEFVTLDYLNGRLYSKDHDQTTNNNWIFTDGGTINSETNDRSGGAGLKWKYIPASTRVSTYPLEEKLMEIPVNANAAVTVTCYCMKDHATNIAAKLIIKGGQIAGVASDVEDVKADDTNWEQLTITFTPTEAGVVEICGSAYYVAGASNAYFADVTAVQS